MNIEMSDHYVSLAEDCDVIARNRFKDKSKKLITYKKEPIKKIQNNFNYHKKQTRQLITNTSDILNSFAVNRKSCSNTYTRSVNPERNHIIDESIKNIDPTDKLVPSHSSNNKLSNIKVVVRFRPFNDIEQELVIHKISTKCSEIQDNTSVIMKGSSSGDCTFVFDRILDMNSTQKDIFNNIAKETVSDVLAGYNGTILTYGQSSSGKTYTMYGNDFYDEDKKGIIPNSM